jgi:hypothetical protein
MMTWLTGDIPDLSSERAPHRDNTATFRQNIKSGHGFQSGLDTKTYWLTVSRNMTLTLAKEGESGINWDIQRMNQAEEGEMGGPWNTNGEKRNSYRLLVGKPEGKRPLGRPRRRRVDNIRMDLGEVGWAGHETRMGRRETRIDCWWESQRERDH